ncbi:alkaline phosphatase [Arenicella chitinivorans]|uniref:Alkaline phosphatase n=1 Tax=Arenicella chitinivorans TaxID=1329800 RepID=A0A918VJD9_9GAMM|nr:choice-of-anchor I family protein [Arenicella chitinivorans]GHA06374.1 alkaline phosphatase [Arenicella chitinivorans]
MIRKIIVFAASALFSHFAAADDSQITGTQTIQLRALGTFKSGPYDHGAAEIASYDVATRQAYVVNGFANAIDVFNLAQPDKPALVNQIKLKDYGSPNSVAVKRGLVAVAVAAKPKHDPGSIVVFDLTGKHLNTFKVGALPDMVTFTPDGNVILSANEGEPNDDYTIDPEGSVSLIPVGEDIRQQSQADVRTADFSAFNTQTLDPAIRIFGKNASVAQDLEPEYITVSADSQTAWVALQENNALAVIDIAASKVTALLPLGTKSHALPGNGIDASDEDGGVHIRTWPVEGMYQPDTITSYAVDGETFIVTANEGDARDYDGYSEETRVGKMNLSKTLIQAYPKLTSKNQLGRLKVSKVGADTDDDGKADRLLAYGARSFSIWSAQGKLVFDSGDQFEQITAQHDPGLFNIDDDRSDNKGPEPEALALGEVDGRVYAFVGLERTGGVMVYDITNPADAAFVDYFTTRNTEAVEDLPEAGDIAPESIVFVSADDSASGQPFLITANEVSGTVSTYAISVRPEKD